MSLNLADRLLTIVVTAAATSAVWLVAGNTRIGTDLSGTAENVGSRLSRMAGGEKGDRPGAAVHPAAVAAPEGEGEGSGGLLIPVAGVSKDELTNSFRDARGGGSRLHEALDIMAPAGTPVLAAAPGTIEKLFRSGDGGNTIYVRSDDRRTIHYYAHLDRYAPALAEGMIVRRAQPLGTVGASGNADPSAPHLHFAVLRTTPAADWWEPATAINPYPLIVGR
jgi:murein DD-endopeptidase MepM/ murein hydrolase activator NlpD